MTSVMHLTALNEKNVPYLCMKYLPKALDGCLSRCHQVVPNPYGFPSDMLQQDPNMRMRDVFKNELLLGYDLYVFHGEFNSLANIYKLQEDLGDAKVVPYLFTMNDTTNCKNNNSHILQNAPVIFVRQPHLASLLSQWADKIVYLPSPCSIDTQDTCLSTGRSEYVFPDDWMLIGHFGKTNKYYSLIDNVSRFHDDRQLAYYELHDMNRHAVMSIVNRMDINISSHDSEFYSQNAIETGMAGVPTVVSVHPSFRKYLENSPFILSDSNNIYNQVMEVVKNIEEYKKFIIHHKWFDVHRPENVMNYFVDVLRSRKVIE